MKKILIALLISVTATARSEEIPEEFFEIEKIYNEKVAALTTQYITALERLQVKYTKKGNLDKALFFSNKIKEIKAKIPSSTNKSKTPTPANEAASWKTIRLDAKSYLGHSLGKLKKGDQVEVKYLSGKWSAYETKWPQEQPLKGCRPQHQIILVDRSIIGSKESKIDLSKVAFFDSLTSTSSQTITVLEDGFFSLRIGDPLMSSNQGVLTISYRVK